MSRLASRARRMGILRARIFGEVARKTSEQDLNVVRLFARRPWQRDLPSWYPPLANYSSLLIRLRTLGLYHNEHRDFQHQMAEQRRERGKGPPKKGEGKQKKKKR